MSVAGDIGAAVQTAVRAIGLEASAGVPLKAESVLVRKRAELGPPGKEAPPKVLIVVGEEGETVRVHAGLKLKKWKVAVVVITATTSPLGEEERVRTWREQIDQKVYDRQRQTFAGLTGFNRVAAAGEGPFDPAGLGNDVNWSTQNYTVEVEEPLP